MEIILQLNVSEIAQKFPIYLKIHIRECVTISVLWIGMQTIILAVAFQLKDVQMVKSLKLQRKDVFTNVLFKNLLSRIMILINVNILAPVVHMLIIQQWYVSMYAPLNLTFMLITTLLLDHYVSYIVLTHIIGILQLVNASKIALDQITSKILNQCRA